MSPLAERKGLSLTVRRVRSRRAVRSDSDGGLLRSMVQNLIANAIRYTEQGRVAYWWDVAVGASALVIEVYDTGIGIRRPMTWNVIFQEFHQVAAKAIVSRVTTRGLGLGLAITHRLSQMLEHPVSMFESRIRQTAAGSAFPCRRGTCNRCRLAGWLPGRRRETSMDCVSCASRTRSKCSMP